MLLQYYVVVLSCYCNVMLLGYYVAMLLCYCNIMLLGYHVVMLLCYCNVMLLGYYVVMLSGYYTIAISQQSLFYIHTDYQYITILIKQRIQLYYNNLHTII